MLLLVNQVPVQEKIKEVHSLAILDKEKEEILQMKDYNYE